jgi:predicted type IV restriction endonuclease
MARWSAMLVCEECNREECADYFIIKDGKVLCLNCTIAYMVHRLERVNKMLDELVKRFEEYANRQRE